MDEDLCMADICILDRNLQPLQVTILFLADSMNTVFNATWIYKVLVINYGLYLIGFLPCSFMLIVSTLDQVI